MSNKVGDCFKFFLPIQNIRTLIKSEGGTKIKKCKIVTSKKSENKFTRWFMSGLFCSSKAMKARQVCSSPWDPHGGWPEYFRTSGPTIISTSGYKKEEKNHMIHKILCTYRRDSILFLLMIQFIFIFCFGRYSEIKFL